MHHTVSGCGSVILGGIYYSFVQCKIYGTCAGLFNFLNRCFLVLVVVVVVVCRFCSEHKKGLGLEPYETFEIEAI